MVRNMYFLTNFQITHFNSVDQFPSQYSQNTLYIPFSTLEETILNHNPEKPCPVD